MTRIEKAVKIVSDLYNFYRQIPKIPEQNLVREEKQNQELQRQARERILRSPESPQAHRR